MKKVVLRTIFWNYLSDNDRATRVEKEMELNVATRVYRI